MNDTIQSSVSDRVFFKTRQALGKTPPLSSRLKVYAFDDNTVKYLGGDSVSTQDLSLFLTNIARKKPRAIILDRLFGRAPPEENAKHFLEEMEKMHIPVYTGAADKSDPSNQTKHDLTEPQYDPSHWVIGDVESNMPFIRHSLHNENGNVYAYEKTYKGAFRGIGHIAFHSIGAVDPLIVFHDKIVPHIGLYAAESFAIKDQKLLVNNEVVPLTERGSVIVNHRPPLDFYSRMKPLSGALARARAHQQEEWIQEGDVVIVIFNFYTGSTDFLEAAPFGNLPGGLYVSTLADSALENRWITPTNNITSLVIILIMSIFGVVLARSTGSVVFWIATILLSLGFFAGCIYLFSYHDIMVPWVLPLVGLLGGGTIQYVKQRLGNELKAVATENQLLVERALRLEEEKMNIQLVERLNLGRAIQQILLPPTGAQDHGSFTFDMSYIPNQEMSGDWVYIWGKDQDEKRVIIGDVVGKGPSAAIPVAILIGILGECEKSGMGTEETLRYLNGRILELFGKQVTCSCSVVVMTRNSMEIDLYNAGSPGWFFRSEGKSRHISMRSTTLGMGTEAYFAHEKLLLTPDSFLFTFTDGYMEGARAFRRLITKLGTIDEAPSFEELQNILDEIGKSFRLEDDRSLLMVKTRSQASTKVS